MQALVVAPRCVLSMNDECEDSIWPRQGWTDAGVVPSLHCSLIIFVLLAAFSQAKMLRTSSALLCALLATLMALATASSVWPSGSATAQTLSSGS
jgi:hypothetical protein